MTWTFWAALVVVIGTVWALIKRYETRLVLLTSGLIMALLAVEPMAAFKQFDKSMTSASLIIAICSSMGFAGVMSLTKCDLHLVSLLTKPLRTLGVLLLPCCMIVTGFISVAISSFAGLCAAVGPTIVTLMVRAGFRPAIAAAAVAGATVPGFLSPGTSHNVFVSKLAEMPIMDYIYATAPRTIGLLFVLTAFMTVLCFLYGDYKRGGFDVKGLDAGGKGPELPENPNLLFAFAPILPVVVLLCFSIWMPELKLSVATAMLIGMLYCIVVTRSNPQEIIKKFFDGMGRGYGNIIGIIIAAGVFSAGLASCGVIEVFVDYLRHSNEVAKLGAAIGPYVLGVMTGSGDAATFAFNEAVTPHAAQFGMTIPDLGYLASIAGAFGRASSPLAGGMIVISGIAMVSPLEVVKRTAPVMACGLVVLYVIS